MRSKSRISSVGLAMALLASGLLSLAQEGKEGKKRPKGPDFREKDMRKQDITKRKEDLRYADFRDAILSEANFRGLKLNGADFRDANLEFARLDETDLTEADFRDARLTSTYFKKAKMAGANLEGQENFDADHVETLRGANLQDATLKGSLENTDLRDADLCGADLSAVYHFPGAKFKNARYDARTIWMKGFDHESAGMKLVTEEDKKKKKPADESDPPQKKEKLTTDDESSAAIGKLRAREVSIDVLWSGIWYKAEVLAKRGDKSLVHYDGFSSQYDEWVTSDRIKLRGSPAPALAQPPLAVRTGFEGLYFRQAVIPKNPELSGGAALKTFPYWFLADGHVLGGSWGGLSDYLKTRRVDDFKKKQPSAWGTYRLHDQSLAISWVGTREESFPCETQTDGLRISRLLRTWPVPEGLLLKGQYVGKEGGLRNQAGAMGTFVYKFRADSTCQYSEVGVVTLQKRDTDNNPANDVYRTGLTLLGSYAINRTALTITDDDQTMYVQVLWAYNEEDARSAAPKLLNIGGNAFLRKE